MTEYKKRKTRFWHTTRLRYGKEWKYVKRRKPTKDFVKKMRKSKSNNTEF